MALGAGCPAADSPPGAIEDAGPTAFVADGVTVPVAALDALRSRIPRPETRSLLGQDGGTTDFVDHVALTQALYRRALDEGLDADPDVELALAMAEREFLAAEFVRREARRRVTPDAVARRYAEMPEFRIPQLHVRHLRLRDDEDAGALLQRLRSGVPFADLARERSADHDTAPSGGDLGWLDLSVVESSFGPELAAAPTGTVVGPLEVPVGGRHLLVAEERRDAIPLEEVEAGLTDALVTEAMEEVTAECQATLHVERPNP